MRSLCLLEMVDRKFGSHTLKQLRLLLDSPDKHDDGLPFPLFKGYYYSTKAHEPFEKIAFI